MATIRVISSLIQAVTLLALTRVLGAQEFGQFAAVSASGAMVAVLGGLGLSSLALRISAFENPRGVAASIALLRWPIVFSSATCTGLVAYVLLGHTALLAITAAVLYAASESIGEAVESLLYGSSRAARAQVAMVARRLIMLLGVTCGFLMNETLVGVVVAASTICVIAGVFLKGTLASPVPFRLIARASVPLWSATVLAKLQTLDVVVASMALSPAQAGIYSAAARVSSPLNTFAVAALSVLTPRLADRHAVDAREGLFRQSRRSMCILAMLLGALSPVVGFTAEFVLGPDYIGAAWVATVLTISTAVAAITQVYVSHFFAAGDGFTVAKIRAILMPSALAVGFIAGAVVGPLGLAVSMLGAQLLLWLMLASAHRRTQGGTRER
ncbi:lipopolysaccharide biosynthesis protein [Microbacterium sp. OR16]|uniref:lipopolysaccharide biosynthesis protein n=1 Tax=Microbacterium sp. OR16 TaxID=3095345 RepID=UPI0039B634B8